MRLKVTVTRQNEEGFYFQDFYDCNSYTVQDNLLYLEEMIDERLQKQSMLVLNLNKISSFYVVWIED